ncbi:tetratricopeptide repeat protein [Haematospirillum sp. 15-248]|uniref:tetratricopeptide repeat protein n=1 Tax=Haematospirillum sp. 15-248 TaxID=2723107 RepID=UPI001438D9CB|nr:tetratricopeptide repeat protein [Haematospirillum sp. 15-248]NKD88413.1 tetratricopeptide repeat protein [Haematospirillum sp. 15-248]
MIIKGIAPVLVMVVCAALPVAGLTAEYGACMAQSRQDPHAALRLAISWEGQAGGASARHCRASALIELGQFSEAAVILEALAGEHRENPAQYAPLLHQAASAWIQAGDPVHALSLLGQVRDITPENATILEDRAELSVAAGRLWEAVDDLNTLLDYRPDYGPALLLRASVWQQLDAANLALADLERALVLSPNDRGALVERGVLLCQAGNTSAARRDWMAVILGSPDSAEAERARTHLATMDIRHSSAP